MLWSSSSLIHLPKENEPSKPRKEKEQDLGRNRTSSVLCMTVHSLCAKFIISRNAKLTDGCAGCSCPLTFWSCLLWTVGVRSPCAVDALATAPALLPAGDLACGELVDVVLDS
ncbi:unnamed protein product [Pieris macdunnoughi]|uniref:Uncharacterized protein n=1 Tax=Pieris macdunnoughi TaxID=345717 RepID=A0A821UBN0_9NEOP|nr:unnamed protein product [Pieris macdunnoughi]